MLRRMDRAYERIALLSPTKGEPKAENAARKTQTLHLIAAGSALLGGSLAVSLQSVSPLLIPAGVLLLVFARTTGGTQRKVQSFEKDFTALLVSLASAVRTGLDPLSALLSAEDLFPPTSQVRQELLKLKHDIDEGKPEEDALRDFAREIPHPDIALFRSAILLARREGSSLSSCLQRLAKVTRQRQSFRRKVRAAIALQKLSSIAIVMCAVTVLVVQFVANPKLLTDAMQHPLGRKALYAGLTAMAIGLVWILRITHHREVQ